MIKRIVIKNDRVVFNPYPEKPVKKGFAQVGPTSSASGGGRTAAANGGFRTTAGKNTRDTRAGKSTDITEPGENLVDDATTETAIQTSAEPTNKIFVPVNVETSPNKVAHQIAIKFAEIEGMVVEGMVVGRSDEGISTTIKQMIVDFRRERLAGIKKTLLTRFEYDPTVKGAEDLVTETRYLLEAMRSAKMAAEDYRNMEMALLTVARLYTQSYSSAELRRAFMGPQPPGGNWQPTGGAVPPQP